MCFHVSKKYPDAKIAKKDIKCYKVVYPKGAFNSRKPNSYEATVQSYAYKEGKVSSEVILRVDCRRRATGIEGVIDKGYHSYKSIKAANAGLRRWHGNLIICKAVIPAGTKYYQNDTEYISERLKFIGPLNTKKK